MGYPEAAWILNELTEQNTSTQNLIKTRREASLTGEGATVYESNSVLSFNEVTNYLCMLGKFIAPVDGIYKVTLEGKVNHRNAYITPVPCVFMKNTDAGVDIVALQNDLYDKEIGWYGDYRTYPDESYSSKLVDAKYINLRGWYMLEYITSGKYMTDCFLKAGEKTVIIMHGERYIDYEITSVKVTYQPLIDE